MVDWSCWWDDCDEVVVLDNIVVVVIVDVGVLVIGSSSGYLCRKMSLTSGHSIWIWICLINIQLIQYVFIKSFDFRIITNFRWCYSKITNIYHFSLRINISSFRLFFLCFSIIIIIFSLLFLKLFLLIRLCFLCLGILRSKIIWILSYQNFLWFFIFFSFFFFYLRHRRWLLDFLFLLTVILTLCLFFAWSTRFTRTTNSSLSVASLLLYLFV